MRFIANLLVARDGTADVLAATAVAGVVSGLPSVTVAVLRRDLSSYARAALTASAALAGAGSWPAVPRYVAGAAVHGALSLWWAAVLAVVLPRQRPVRNGAVAGLAIAALDLGVVGRRIRAVRDLDPVPQIADHVAFGVAVALVLHARRSNA